MNIHPTPFTAAIAGVFAAIAWPFVWAKFGGPAAAAGTTALRAAAGL